MTYIIGIIVAAVFGYLILTNLQSTDPKDEAAAREILELHRHRTDVSEDEILAVLQKHGRNRAQGEQVARMLLVRFRKVGKFENDRIHAMPQVRRAVAKLPVTVANSAAQ
ncbi:MAG: hypothetical protein CME36_05215 [unclassified Hahellaceae]|nr:hypothetical protein [Hahellaceae bacterium]|tara:strand:+ start:48937 stop:49266 length:330 start_codon:yes stop_codon:yes gene_type:complete